MRIAVGGSSLAGARADPETLHLQDLFEIWRRAGDEVVVIHPPESGGDPSGSGPSRHPKPPVGRARALREPLLGDARRAAQAAADVLFVPEPTAPLVSPLPVVSAHSARRRPQTSLAGRLQQAIGRAGLRGASALLWLDDLPPIDRPATVVRVMPAFVGPAFAPEPLTADTDHLRRLGFPPEYCLAFAGSTEELMILLAAWSWVVGAIGEAARLELVGGTGGSSQETRRLAVAAGIEGTVRWIEQVPLATLPALLRGARAVLHAGATATGQELRWALACGVPIAGLETPETMAVVGDAGYLVPPRDTRALGAACVTLIVEEQLSEELKARGLNRAEAYSRASARQAWAEVFRSILEGAHGRRRR